MERPLPERESDVPNGIVSHDNKFMYIFQEGGEFIQRKDLTKPFCDWELIACGNFNNRLVRAATYCKFPNEFNTFLCFDCSPLISKIVIDP